MCVCVYVCMCVYADLVKTFILAQIGKAGREYCTLLLQNIIDSQCRAFSETAGAGVNTKMETVKLCLEEGVDGWIDYLLNTRPQSGAAQGLPRSANMQQDYDRERRKSAVDVLGKLLLSVSKQEAAARDIARDSYLQPGVNTKVFYVLKQVLEKEKQVFVQKRTEKKSPDVDVLVRLLEALPPFFSCATLSQATEMVTQLQDALIECLPDDFARSSLEEKSFYTPLFMALLQLVRMSKSQAVLPLVRKHLLEDANHPFQEHIRDTLNQYTLQMEEEEARSTALKIVCDSQQQTSLNPNILRVERCIVDQVCGRLLQQLTEDSLTKFFVDCLPHCFKTFTLGGKAKSGPRAEEPFIGKHTHTHTHTHTSLSLY